MTDARSYNPSDEEVKLWLQLTSEGDQTAFTQLLRSYWNKVYTQALTYLKSTQQAQELTQDVFVKIWAARAKLAQVQRFPDYLFIVARNEIVSTLRKKGTAFLLPGDAPEDVFLRPDNQLHYKELHGRLMKAIDLLPPTRKIVFKLSRLEGKSYEEIGTAMGISRNGVKDHIVKALNFLRHHLNTPNGNLLMLILSTTLCFK